MNKVLLGMAIFSTIFAVCSIVTLIWFVVQHADLRIIVSLLFCVLIGLMMSLATIAEYKREKNENNMYR